MTTINQHRHPGEDAARPEKEKGTTPFEIAPGNDTGNSTVEHPRETDRGLYLPLAWVQLSKMASVTDRHIEATSRHKTRSCHREAGGPIDPALAALLALAAVAGILLVGVL